MPDQPKPIILTVEDRIEAMVRNRDAWFRHWQRTMRQKFPDLLGGPRD